MKIQKIQDSNQKSQICNKILRALPEWFGIESANEAYTSDVVTMDTWAASIDENTIGFISINRHNSQTAEIHVMGITKEFHNQGLGRKLIEIAEQTLALENFKFLTVKTLAATHPDPNYQKTRNFYLKTGFVPLEEFKTLWNEYNPCLFLVKAIQTVNLPIRAIMIPAPDWKEGLSWYEKAFPTSKRIALPTHDFECLMYKGVSIEIVKSDEKVSPGPFGSVVYWDVDSFDNSLSTLKELGATLYRGPMKIENNTFMCQLKDPYGNLIGIRGKNNGLFSKYISISTYT